MVLSSDAVFAGDYRVIRELGRGGMGTVYLVEQLSTSKQRALKVMHPGLLEDEKSRERFLLEARVGSKIDSEHIVEVIAAGFEEAMDMPWLAMELLEGETLASTLRQRGYLPLEEVLTLFRQLCHALGEAHEAGLVHRDVKPDNIFLQRPRSPGAGVKVKLLDFGIAKLVQPTVRQGNTTSPLGTPLFMAPEQIEPGPVDARADVWALGLIAFYCLTGRHYWKAGNNPDTPLTGLLMEVALDEVEPPSARAARYGVRVPDGFDRWFARCLHRDLDRRFADANAAWAAMAAELGLGGWDADPFGATDVAPRPAAAPESPYLPVEPTRQLSDPVSPPATSMPPGAPPSTSGGPPWMWIALSVVGTVAVLSTAAVVVVTTRDADPLPVAPVEAVPGASDAGGTMVPLAPRADAGASATRDAGTHRDAGVPARRAEPTLPLSPQDRRTVADFERLSNRSCRAWLAQSGRRRQSVRVVQSLAGDGTPMGWQVTPDDQGLRVCLTHGGGAVHWTGTGSPRSVAFRIVLR